MVEIENRLRARFRASPKFQPAARSLRAEGCGLQDRPAGATAVREEFSRKPKLIEHQQRKPVRGTEGVRGIAQLICRSMEPSDARPAIVLNLDSVRGLREAAVPQIFPIDDPGASDSTPEHLRLFPR